MKPNLGEQPVNAFLFITEVDWTEPWLIGLMAFHTIVTVLTLITRNNGNIQGALFFTLLILVYSSESLNEIAASHWKSFSRHQYFDSSGMFISTVFSAPLLLNCIGMVGHWMWTSGTLMINLKQRQLRQRLNSNKQRSQSQSQSADISNSNNNRPVSSDNSFKSNLKSD